MNKIVNYIFIFILGFLAIYGGIYLLITGWSALPNFEHAIILISVSIIIVAVSTATIRELALEMQNE